MTDLSYEMDKTGFNVKLEFSDPSKRVHRDNQQGHIFVIIIFCK